MSNINVSVIMSFVSICLAIATFFFGRASASKTEGKEAGSILTELSYIKNGVEKIQNQLEDLRRNYDDLKEKVILIDQSVKRAHERIDDLTRKLGYGPKDDKEK